jgi:hypothetical protein
MISFSFGLRFRHGMKNGVIQKSELGKGTGQKPFWVRQLPFKKKVALLPACLCQPACFSKKARFLSSPFTNHITYTN